MSETNSTRTQTRFATWDHRVYVWRNVRRRGDWPNRAAWRFLILGRWKGF